MTDFMTFLWFIDSGGRDVAQSYADGSGIRAVNAADPSDPVLLIGGGFGSGQDGAGEGEGDGYGYGFCVGDGCGCRNPEDIRKGCWSFGSGDGAGDRRGRWLDMRWYYGHTSP